jgi:hypothetical protein
VIYLDVVPLHRLKPGEKFVLTSGGASDNPIEVLYRTPELANMPEGQLSVIRVKDSM